MTRWPGSTPTPRSSPNWWRRSASVTPRPAELRGEDPRQVPHARAAGGQAQQNARLRRPLGGETASVALAQVPRRDCEPGCRDVALDQLGPAAHLDPAERTDG